MLTFLRYEPSGRPVDLKSARDQLAARKVGAWINNEADGRAWSEEAREAREEAQRLLFDALQTGGLAAYVETDKGSRVVPSEYWHDDNRWESRLEGRIINARVPVIPSEMIGCTIFVVASELEAFIKHETSVSRRGAKNTYEWPPFIEEAVRQLEHEGGIGPDFGAQDLVDRMTCWLEEKSGWGKLPGESRIKDKCLEARKRYEAS